MSIDTYVKTQSKVMLMTLACMLALLVGYVDYLTGFELRIDVFYLFPISLAGWYISQKAGFALSALSVVLIFVSDWLSKPDHHIYFVDLWNTVMILLFFIIVTMSLSRLRATLDEQRQLTTDLQKALDDIKITNESLEAFAYSVSHDLRGPLWRIESFAEMISEKYSDKLDTKGKDYIQRICVNARIMKDLIDALLKLSRYSRGNLNRAQVDLTAMVRRTFEENAKGWPGRTIRTEAADDVLASGDPALLQVIISNLVENAFKFTNRRDVAMIEFGTIKEKGKDIYFIKDNGVGFNMRDGDRLFNPFQRLHSEPEFPGFGIGLATVQRIIHRHGGKIWAESEVEQGTTFYFTLS